MYYKYTVSILLMLCVLAGCVDSGKQRSATESDRHQSPDVERGRVVVATMGCNDCHTPDYMVKRANIVEDDWLIGGPLGFLGPHGTVYPTNLRLLINDISEEDWLILARKMRKDSPMAWVMLPKMSEQDLRAVYRFVKFLGPKGDPALPRLPAGVTPTTQFVNIPSDISDIHAK